uniref:Ulp1 protease-like n=1 Tax=Oryza sativa subsp. japonica TaxID=39947 RepID=Q6ZF02_ORYSJ|nr:hypothetical protein [Oryza sativa Japonica Group]
MEGVPDKKRQPEFNMKTIRTTRIVSILVSLVLLGQEDTSGYKYKPPRRTGGHTHHETINTITMIGMTTSSTPNTNNIQAYILQDKTPDIDFRDRHGYSPTVSPDTVRRYESAISNLAGLGFEEEGYPVVDYESDLQTAMSTTVR